MICNLVNPYAKINEALLSKETSLKKWKSIVLEIATPSKKSYTISTYFWTRICFFRSCSIFIVTFDQFLVSLCEFDKYSKSFFFKTRPQIEKCVAIFSTCIASLVTLCTLCLSFHVYERLYANESAEQRMHFLTTNCSSVALPILLKSHLNHICLLIFFKTISFRYHTLFCSLLETLLELV